MFVSASELAWCAIAEFADMCKKRRVDRLDMVEEAIASITREKKPSATFKRELCLRWDGEFVATATDHQLDKYFHYTKVRVL